MRSEKCNNLARTIWQFAIERNIWLSAEHCPGILNDLADFGSRSFNDNTEWSLRESVFDDICKIYGIPDIDLFASRLNKKLENFCSWRPDPEAKLVDAFMQNWGKFGFVYIFPPFGIMSGVLQKFVFDKAEGIVIAPCWPTRPWFTRLMDIVVDIPMLLPSNSNVLFLPSSREEHPLSRKLSLMVCRCSPDVGRRRVFLNRLSGQCGNPREDLPKNCTRPIINSGRSFVSEGIWIPCREMLI